MQIHTLEQLLNTPIEEIKECRNVGAKTVDEILFWLINTRENPVNFRDANGITHSNFFIPAKGHFTQIKVLMNAYTEFSILSTLNKEFKTTQAEEFDLKEDPERTSLQKEAYFEKLHLQETQIKHVFNECKKVCSC